MRRPRFRLLSHTADLRLAVWGEDEAALLDHAVQGAVRAAMDRDVRVEPRTAIAIEPWPAEPALRLVRAVNEALFQLYAHDLAATGVRLEDDGARLLLADLPGGRRPEVEIKAATYHAVRVRSSGARRSVVLTLDL